MVGSLTELTPMHRFALSDKMVRAETIHAKTTCPQNGHLIVMRHGSELGAGIQRMPFCLTRNTAIGIGFRVCWTREYSTTVTKLSPVLMEIGFPFLYNRLDKGGLCRLDAQVQKFKQLLVRGMLSDFRLCFCHSNIVV